MARIGMNPSRTKRTDYRPARVTAAILVHIPHLTGYYQDRWPVLHTCLTSLIKNTKTPYDLMVFDNASCREVQAYLDDLQAQGIIDYLLRSRRNVGKIGAYKILFGAAPGELVAYCDDDFFFEPGWLEAQLEIIDTFPKVGMVSGYVIPSFFVPERMDASLKFAEANTEVKLIMNADIPAGWIEQWAESTGRDIEAALEKAAAFQPIALNYHGVNAFAAANHDQFLAPKEVVESVLPKEWSGQLMGQMLAMDEAINAKGWLRLSTYQRTCQHLGNRLPPDIAERVNFSDLGQGPLPFQRKVTTTSPAWLKRVLRWKPVRAVLLGLYSHLFHWINPD